MTENELCPGERLQSLVEAMGSDERQATADLELLLARHPGDPRLHFLKGSLAAGSTLRLANAMDCHTDAAQQPPRGGHSGPLPCS